MVFATTSLPKLLLIVMKIERQSEINLARKWDCVQDERSSRALVVGSMESMSIKNDTRLHRCGNKLEMCLAEFLLDNTVLMINKAQLAIGIDDLNINAKYSGSSAMITRCGNT
ncbi:cytochrome Cbb3 oxidase maturation factor, putative [Babesia ovis]|uniref:Cytochrome Cbb3 oxidase maturation factor, putative n=1 Tax=Babesia ovis TaxID=5869 RepID=A0A9W5WUN7_BABOV|nr:cytochrome Cbb3 oxidase maturation factor, putative [Babesia ovis]